MKDNCFATSREFCFNHDECPCGVFKKAMFVAPTCLDDELSAVSMVDTPDSSISLMKRTIRRRRKEPARLNLELGTNETEVCSIEAWSAL
jgi:hypothetical protein